ncbi:SpoVT/AbrB domain protein [Natrialba asiatica DSM 12278]|uniref:SpoVT/AbrB domain protein n=2 Tax=Natrialba asiatica TaxID=64602 RepID=M0B6G9_NATA1|nr:SpoVT/AbrB domain protein [Natrialba asiatica DSM 12278]
MELQLYTHLDGSIVIRSSAEDVEQLAEATVEIDGDDPERIQQAIQAAHTCGFETVTLTPRQPFTDAGRRSARSAVRDLVGTDILAESETEITVKHLMDPSTVSVRQSLVQIQYAAVLLHEDATVAFVNADDAHAHVDERADRAARFVQMIAWHFSRSLISLDELDRLDVSRPDLFDYYATANRLSAVVDRAVRTARIAEKLPEPLSEEIAGDVRSAAEDARNAVDTAVAAILEDEDGVSTAHEAIKYRDDAVTAVDTLERTLFDGSRVESVPTAVALTSALDHLRRTADHGHAIAKIAVRAAIRAENLDN